MPRLLYKDSEKSLHSELTKLSDCRIDEDHISVDNISNDNCGLKVRNLFFDDGIRRIDFILAWESEIRNSKTAATARHIFELNLLKEGLHLEYVIPSTSISFLKIHATYEVLRRYADILKFRMPIKEAQIPQVHSRRPKCTKFAFLQKLINLHHIDYKRLPPISRSYTCPYSSSKEYLFEIPENPEDRFSNATRSWVVDYILRRKYFANTSENNFAFGINTMISEGYYCAAYPLHEGQSTPDCADNLLKSFRECWSNCGNFYKQQPIHHIRLYFGETIALYFAWLGFYTSLLIPATVVGVIVFLYGLIVMHTGTVSKELCDPANNITMCPLCDKLCKYLSIHEICFEAKLGYIFDNAGTVIFAVFMSLWGTFFLEFWKRRQASIQYKWDLTTFIEEEQPPRPEYLSRLERVPTKRPNPVTGLNEPYLPFWQARFPRYLTSYSTMVLLTMSALGAVLAVIAYRVSLFTTLNFLIYPKISTSTIKIFNKYSSFITTVIAAVVNLIMILILNAIYAHLVFWMTDWECLRTQSEYDNSITLKLFVLRFINYFSSIFYIAFFKGQFTGRPGGYVTIFGNRQEECSPAGCLSELCLQLAITMVGKQLIKDNLKETFLPWIIRFIKKLWSRNKLGFEKAETPWEEDYLLQPEKQMLLFYEYLEMVIQFGFLTIFCAIFPLGPLFALLNNIMEIRVDANKFTTQLRRPIAVKSADIGIWYSVLYAISRIAVVTNALIIAMTSDFIPQMIYTHLVSEDGSYTGYISFTLSYFNTSDFSTKEKIDNPDLSTVQICRYRGFRNPPWSSDPYHRSVNYWYILSARLAFVCIFEVSCHENLYESALSLKSSAAFLRVIEGLKMNKEEE